MSKPRNLCTHHRIKRLAWRCPDCGTSGREAESLVGKYARCFNKKCARLFRITETDVKKQFLVCGLCIDTLSPGSLAEILTDALGENVEKELLSGSLEDIVEKALAGKA